MADCGGMGLRLGSQIEAVKQQTQSAEKDDGSEVRGDDWRNADRYDETAVATSEILNHAGQQHIEKSAANLEASGCCGRARSQLHAGDVLAAMRAAIEMREHGLPAEHARARLHRLILQRNCHGGRKTSISSVEGGYSGVK